MLTYSFRYAEPTTLRAIAPMLELGAYETLWVQPKASFKSIAAQFRGTDALPSELVPHDQAMPMAERVIDKLRSNGVKRFGVRINRAGDYPDRLRDAEHPVELLYFQGDWELAETPSVAIVGSRNPSEEGVRRAQKLVKHLVADDWTIMSGLAAGIDTVAHTTALGEKGRTIAVLGTPLHQTYPADNAELQQRLARDFLVISQVPVARYESQTWRGNRFFFPERNVTMSALTVATVIVEASDTSGTLIQARAALKQGRKLFILESCFHKPGLKWPHRFAEQGAVRVESYEQIRDGLAQAAN